MSAALDRSGVPEAVSELRGAYSLEEMKEAVNLCQQNQRRGDCSLWRWEKEKPSFYYRVTNQLKGIFIILTFTFLS